MAPLPAAGAAQEFAAHGLVVDWVQANVSLSRRAGTLRGLHYQEPPYEEAKLIHCTAGTVYDVIVDLRPTSATYGRWTAVELSAARGPLLYIPRGFAHGFQALVDNSQLNYLMSELYRPERARGIRWDDPALAIDWPSCAERIVSARDLTFPDFVPCAVC